MSSSMVKSLYSDKVAMKLQDTLQLKIPPRLVKIVLNMGVGKAASNKKYLDEALALLATISGRKPVQTKARRSESGFGIREGWPIGCKVTLRREGMYDFLDRFLNVVIPRIPDFSGLNPKAFDGQGNYTMGMRDCIAFPECDIEGQRIGLDMTVVTSAFDDKAAYLLLSELGFPFKQKS